MVCHMIRVDSTSAVIGSIIHSNLIHIAMDYPLINSYYL